MQLKSLMFATFLCETYRITACVAFPVMKKSIYYSPIKKREDDESKNCEILFYPISDSIRLNSLRLRKANTKSVTNPSSLSSETKSG